MKERTTTGLLYLQGFVRAVVLILCAYIAVYGGIVLARDILARPAQPQPLDGACTHGASSVGPVTIRGGRVVSGSTTPHATGCTP